ncbi:hypothetical protein LTR91_024129 [Friedmanniomyces endolithicus]|uniref:Uncharacterized protein n=1 Tax=Friedmanniomyces endolithicus TaxID=329885 RepID=A0AAN6H370_9PEZI|nr:hypothetical protein LTR57_024462 [Friedmanniomyces endolithicus]KAK0952918.1 hypothetical protein LTR91_024129 [Friedmanniomyces endolithicus]KAK0953252.1 hypothetical protein LTS01_024468 [Friedmanniomyces endolithicus]
MTSGNSNSNNENMNPNIGGESGNSNDYSLPSPDTLSQAGELHVLDEHGDKVTFKSLYAPTDGVKRHLIIFIRHFSCGSCESYVRTLASHKQLNATPDLHTILIGCGQPSVVPSYRDRTHTRFPIYCDPDRALYAQLNMTCNLDGGAQKPKYITDSTLSTTLNSFPNVLKSGFNITSRGFNSGNFSQNGGEWLFVDGELKRCHIMQHTRDHAEVEELENILGFSHEASPAYDDTDAVSQEAIRYNYAQSRVAAENAGRRAISGGDPIVNALQGAYSRSGATLPRRRRGAAKYLRLPDPEEEEEEAVEELDTSGQPESMPETDGWQRARAHYTSKLPFSKTWRAERREKKARVMAIIRDSQHGDVELTDSGIREWGRRAGRLDAERPPEPPPPYDTLIGVDRGDEGSLGQEDVRRVLGVVEEERGEVGEVEREEREEDEVMLLEGVPFSESGERVGGAGKRQRRDSEGHVSGWSAGGERPLDDGVHRVVAQELAGRRRAVRRDEGRGRHSF